MRCTMNGEEAMRETTPIRCGRPADAWSVRACAVAAYSRYIAAIGCPPAPMVADFDALIAAGSLHVAEGKGGNLTGFIVFFPVGGAMMLENVAVHPDAAGRGIGRALIAFCEEEARRAGLPAVTLYTNAAMIENLAIYPRLGYMRTGRRTEDGFDRVYFRKSL